jgi:ribosomal protein RSM22 (predicted rRNA methylase)
MLDTLQQQIDALLKSVPASQQKNTHKTVSNRYRSKAPKALTSREEAILYLAARLPATYAALQKVFGVLKELFPLETLQSLLDLGAGAGASRWLVDESLPSIKKLTLLERNSHMYAIGQKLKHPLGAFMQADYQTAETLPPHDATLMSYTLSEIPESQRLSTLSKVWAVTGKLLILIEPGTPDGFQVIKDARAHLIKHGAFILAPCGHEGACPVLAPDWCHFSTRLNRSKTHQRVKAGTLSFEDEKFSYLIASKEKPDQPTFPRIIRPPLQRKGHLSLDLCTKGGIKRETLTQSKDPLYKVHKKLEWGDLYE